MKHIFKALIIFVFLTAAGCQCNKNRKKADLSGIDLNLQIHRFDREFFQIDPRVPQQFAALDSQYSGFATFYVEQILRLGNFKKDSAQTFQRVEEYIFDPYVKEVRDSVEKTFADFLEYEKQLELAMRYFKFYFPEKNIPQVLTFISNFTYSAITFDTTHLAIGLDMHLGENFKYYSALFPKYLYEKFTPEFLVANAMKSFGSLHFQIEPRDNKLLSAMIANGLGIYFLDVVMPEAQDHAKIGYNRSDIEWCKNNEPEIWNFFIDKELLYSAEVLENRQYVNPGPSTTGMPRESPGNVGTWVGWQIVRKYAEKFPEMKFEELLKVDPQEMLIKSGYKPKG